MQEQPSAQLSKPRLHARVFALIASDQVLSQTAYFALMPVLPLLLTLKLGSAQEQWAALAIGALTLMTRGGSLFVAPFLHKLSVRGCLRFALGLIAVSYAVVAVSGNPWVLVIALGFAGIGFSSNGTGVRSFVVLSTSDKSLQNRGFAVIQVVANCCAALGPVLGTFVLDGGLYTPFLLSVSAVFVVAAVFAPLAAPAGVMLNQGSLRPPLTLGIVRELFNSPSARRITLVAMLGSILMGQFFSSFSLVFAGVADEPMIRALFYTLNGVLVVIVQIPVSYLVERRLQRGTSALSILVFGVCILGLSMPLFAAREGVAGIVLVCLGVVLFTVGETIFTPILNVAYANTAEGRPVVESMNMRQLTSAVGEGVGAWAGLSVFVSLSGSQFGLVYWLGLLVLSALTLFALVPRRMGN
ncbi:MFS transporter [Paenarthrobacter sp. NPDC058040]|uniref:MFS transporter n=1 Tax=unclassified Paenarthrobacter TaxID=2634190 RepID=UPI0036DB1BE4